MVMKKKEKEEEGEGGGIEEKEEEEEEEEEDEEEEVGLHEGKTRVARSNKTCLHTRKTRCLMKSNTVTSKVLVV